MTDKDLLIKISLLKEKQKNFNKEIFSLTKELNRNKDELEDLIKARYIIIEVAKLTQDKFKERVEGLITLALQSVFPMHVLVSLDRQYAHSKSTLTYESRSNTPTNRLPR